MDLAAALPKRNIRSRYVTATGQLLFGWRQSLGRVELPLAAAAQAWPYRTYGSRVTVSP